ncbi:MAG TPA: alpha/beta hydrolase [Povalibacter sp.]
MNIEKIAAVATVALATAAAPVQAAEAPQAPTVVLVHGAFADSSSWSGVAEQLQAHGVSVVAAANPLRGVAEDARYVSNLVNAIRGPVVLVGHSYGGAVISNVASDPVKVKALVYVAAFAPDVGESAGQLAGKFPGGTLGEALAAPVPLPSGGRDLYIDQNKFWKQFAADVGESQARVMAIGQRPIAEAALGEPSKLAAWKQVPSYFVYGTADKNIPAAALGFMADRAGSRKTVVVDGASHVVMTSNPQLVAELIEQAVATR